MAMRLRRGGRNFGWVQMLNGTFDAPDRRVVHLALVQDPGRSYTPAPEEPG